MAVITSLVGYWPMDESSGSALDSHGSNSLDDHGSTGTATGKVGNARDLEADNFNYFSHADTADLSVGDIDFTVACWVNFESFDVLFPALIAKSDPDSAQYGYMVLYNTTRNRFVIEASGTANGSTDQELDADTFGAASFATWYFVVAWHDSVNNQLGIAINGGTADVVSYTAGVFDSSARFTVGARDLVGDPGQRLDGLIDEVGFWKKVLTSAERTWLYNSGNGRSYAEIVAESGPTFTVVGRQVLDYGAD